MSANDNITHSAKFANSNIISSFRKLKLNEEITILSECGKQSLIISKRKCTCPANCGERLAMFVVNPDRTNRYSRNTITFVITPINSVSVEAKNLDCGICAWNNYGWIGFKQELLEENKEKFTTVTIKKSEIIKCDRSENHICV